MANSHFGNIGDIWKHLALAEILSIDKKAVYCESHAGSARYTLEPSLERDHGIYYFLKHAPKSQFLASSAYFSILRNIRGNDRLSVFPGSPLIAMLLIHDNGSRFLFCDIDDESLDNIKSCAEELGVSSARTVQAEGIATISEMATDMTTQDASKTFILIDPFLPFEESINGINSVALFYSLSKKGLSCMFWYGYKSTEDGTAIVIEMRKNFSVSTSGILQNNIWCGDISLKQTNNPDYINKSGLLGCGIVCSHLSDSTIRACQNLGNELASVYSDARLPGGQSGAIEFTTITI